MIFQAIDGPEVGNIKRRRFQGKRGGGGGGGHTEERHRQIGRDW